MNQSSLKHNQFVYKTLGKSPVDLEEFVEHI